MAPRPQILPFGVPDFSRIQSTVVPKRTRRSAPKARTGCLGCKKRHLKCDERRPVCGRCAAAGRECSGYPPVENERRQALDIPAEEAFDDHPPIITSSADMARNLRLPTMSRNPQLQPFSQDQVPYFDLFQHQLAEDLTGIWSFTFWTRTVLYETMQDDCVRLSVLALAALSHALIFSAEGQDRSMPISFRMALLQGAINDSHEKALRYSNRAISMLRSRIDNSEEVISPKTVLIVTLLLVTYDLMQGNYESADRLMTSGLYLLKDSINILKRGRFNGLTLPDTHNASSTPTSRANDDIGDISHLLPRLFVGNTFAPFCLMHRRGNFMNSFRASVDCVFPDPELDSFDVMAQLWSQYLTCLCFFQNRCMWHLADPEARVDTKLEAERLQHLRRLERWKDILQVYIIKAAFNKDDDDEASHLRRNRDGRTLCMIKMHLTVHIIFAHGCLDRTSLTYDKHWAEFKMALDLSATFIKDPPVPRIGFTVDTGIHPTLCFIVMLCRNGKLRRRGLSYLRSLNWREGAYDTELMALGLQGLISLEEDGADRRGFIPPTSRYSWIAASWDLKERKLNAVYRRRQPGGADEPDMVQVALDINAV